MHTLAEVYNAKGDFEAAVLWCTRAIDLRIATVGRNHVLFHMSPSLLSQIYEAQRDQVEAEGYRNQLPVGIQGISQNSIALIKIVSILKIYV